MDASSAKSPRLLWAGPAIVAVAALLAVVCFIDPTGDYPELPEGPGLTLDESFNVQQGVYLAEAVRGFGIGILHPDTIREVFGDPFYLADHPPLGRLWIGVCHQLARWLYPTPLNGSPYVVACGRTAPPMAFALTVFLVGWTASRWYGHAGGIAAAVALVLMPRVFGHAHLASLETFIGLTFTAAVLCVAALWRPPARPRILVVIACGAVFGLALATKIQAVLLTVPIAVWALCYWRHRAIVPLVVWGLVAVGVFFALWPWLWLSPGEHLVEYLRRTTERQAIKVWYFGNEYADVDVPWHYPFVMFLATVPVGLHALGFFGLFARRQTNSDSAESPRGEHNPRDVLVLLCLLFPLIVFARPGGAVYDGARLFLVSFPLWAMFVGRGAAIACGWLTCKWSRRVGIGAISVFLAAQGWGHVALHPCYLSYYNLLVGGPRGAEALGLEVTYWGDSVTREFLESCANAMPRTSRIETFPILHTFQLDGLMRQSPILRQHDLHLEPYRGFERMQSRYLLLFRRRADLPEPIRNEPPRSHILAEVRRCGVQLAALYEIAPQPVEKSASPSP